MALEQQGLRFVTNPGPNPENFWGLVRVGRP